jgi:nicotinamide mononucleotide adenylyltransferase
MSTEEIAAKAKMWGDTSTMLWQQARKYASEADYNEKTMDTRIEKAGYETMGSLLENMETIARTQFTKAQTDAIAENIAIAWYNAGTNRMNATTAADHVANELFKTMGELDIKQKQLLKDWIYQGVHAGVTLLEGVTDLVKIKALIKAASKGIKEVVILWLAVHLCLLLLLIVRFLQLRYLLLLLLLLHLLVRTIELDSNLLLQGVLPGSRNWYNPTCLCLHCVTN